VDIDGKPVDFTAKSSAVYISWHQKPLCQENRWPPKSAKIVAKYLPRYTPVVVMGGGDVSRVALPFLNIALNLIIRVRYESGFSIRPAWEIVSTN